MSIKYSGVVVNTIVSYSEVKFKLNNIMVIVIRLSSRPSALLYILMIF